MAKVKQIKSMQERLEEAIVPKEQAPFAIPENWCWVKLGAITEILAGGTPSRANKNYWGNGIPWVKISDMQDKVVSTTEEEITLEGLRNSSAKILPKGTILFSIFATIGAISILGIEACTNQAIVGLKLNQDIETNYIYYALLLFKDVIKLAGKGVAQKNINQSVIKGIELPLAPITEQKRIVDKIESLFSRLDEAKELIQKSLDEFEDRKSAILHKAFNGEFIRFQSNKTVKISEVAKVNPRTVKVICNDDDMVSFVPMRAVSEISGTVQEEMNEKYGKVKKGFTYFEQGDVLFAKITPCMENGKCFIAQNLKNGFGFASTEFYVFKCGENIYNKYLWYILRDRGFRSNAAQVMTGAVGQQRVPKSYLENYSILLPSVDEQREIVRILDNFFEKEDKSKELLDMIDQIEEMKKSILARAFRGELGTHSDADEPVIELVRKILLENDMDNNIGLKKKSKRAEEIVMESRTIMEVLSNGNKITPEKLKEETGLNIDEFYDELKKLVNSNMVKEIREDGEVYLEAINENRSS